MVRKAAPRFFSDKLIGFEWLDPDDTTQSSFYQGVEKEELQQNVGRFLYADHAEEVEKYEVAAP